MIAAKTFKALGDPIRLEIVQRLSKDASMSITNLFDGFDVSRQAARKHLQVLENVELVQLITEGRQTKVALKPKSLAEVKSFITSLEEQWDKRLESLRDAVENSI